MVDFFIREKDAKECNSYGILQPPGKRPFYPYRLAFWAGRFQIRCRRVFLKHLCGPVGILAENMKPYFKSEKGQAGIKVCNIFFSEKTGYAIGIKLGLRDVGINGIFKLTEYND